MRFIYLLCLLLLFGGCNPRLMGVRCPEPQKTMLKKQKLRKPLKPVKQAPVWPY
ncbi:hypothetical protein [Pontibacter beigongshangensis]|uniref:hypothetical protein n=1 Tax=Pontibacter beigongshangensis TaxID=2574733 RepID=UPI0016503E20|nr:hypothetical protein [Pontibacter beigongshangensis]